MKKQQFTDDLQKIYDEVQRRQEELNGYYELMKGEHSEAQQLVDRFLNLLQIRKGDDSVMAALTRIVNLREDALEQILQKSGLSDEEIRAKKELAYGFVSMMHIARHESLIAWIEEQKLLTPFYRALIVGVHFVGLRLSEWQSHWTAHIIHGVNLELSELFDGDDAKVFEMLQSNSLLDLDEGGNVGDRCYSVLVKDGVQGSGFKVQEDDVGRGVPTPTKAEHEEGLVIHDSSATLRDGRQVANHQTPAYRSIAYAEAFPEQVTAVVEAFENLILLLQEHEDEVYDQKREWIAYLEALAIAFAHKAPNELIGKWAEVDRRWMAVTTPIQVGHPLEYYEDHYRKAVALEWDLRIVNPKLQESSNTRTNIKLFAHEMAADLGGKETMTKNLLQVDTTQLYVGQPMLYYAAEFNGLFSAQVVPNDEKVSTELGKKIFAYADFVHRSQLAKPVMELSVETFGEEFVLARRSLARKAPDLWHRIYDVSTIGHEFGHILWIDSDTETLMNSSGQFKNIEEFKATTGGLMAFFHREDAALSKHLMDDLISRAVGLMAWQQVGEVLPYYCEGLIHLHILFGCGAIRYDKQIEIDYDKYGAMKRAYKAAYKDLARTYLAKKDAAEYLGKYALKENGVYLPTNPKVRRFVEYYYSRYQEIGQKVYKQELEKPEWEMDESMV